LIANGAQAHFVPSRRHEPREIGVALLDAASIIIEIGADDFDLARNDGDCLRLERNTIATVARRFILPSYLRSITN
jgi:hypothetical protein